MLVKVTTTGDDHDNSRNNIGGGLNTVALVGSGEIGISKAGINLSLTCLQSKAKAEPGESTQCGQLCKEHNNCSGRGILLVISL